EDPRRWHADDLLARLAPVLVVRLQCLGVVGRLVVLLADQGVGVAGLRGMPILVVTIFLLRGGRSGGLEPRRRDVNDRRGRNVNARELDRRPLPPPRRRFLLPPKKDRRRGIVPPPGPAHGLAAGRRPTAP